MVGTLMAPSSAAETPTAGMSTPFMKSARQFDIAAMKRSRPIDISLSRFAGRASMHWRQWSMAHTASMPPCSAARMNWLK